MDWKEKMAVMTDRLEQALEQATNEIELEDAVARLAGEAIEDAIADEVMLYFRVGNGREVIKQAVCERLDLHYRKGNAVATGGHAPCVDCGTTDPDCFSIPGADTICTECFHKGPIPC
jgi:hypothetical protein